MVEAVKLKNLIRDNRIVHVYQGEQCVDDKK